MKIDNRIRMLRKLLGGTSLALQQERPQRAKDLTPSIRGMNTHNHDRRSKR
jgi:hypothetical protein